MELLYILFVAGLVIFIVKRNTKLPEYKEVDCKPHIWTSDVKNELYCSKCNKKPG